MRTIRILSKAALLAGATALFSACAFLGQKMIEKPQVALERVNLKDVGVSGATVVFGVQVMNPNPFAIEVDSVRYDVEIGGRAFTSGKLDQGAKVGAKDKAIVEIPVPVRYTDVFSSVFELVSKGVSTYRVKGDASFGLLKIPFDNTGELKFKK